MDLLTTIAYVVLIITIIIQFNQIKNIKVRSVKSATEKTALSISAVLILVAAIKASTNNYHYGAFILGMFIAVQAYYKTGITNGGFLVMSRIYTKLPWSSVKAAKANEVNGLIELELDHRGRFTRLYFNNSEKDTIKRLLEGNLEVTGDGLKSGRAGKTNKTKRK